MNFAIRQSLKIFVTGIIILVISILFFYKLNYNSFLNYELEEFKSFAEKISKDIDQHLIEKVRKTKIIIAAPVIINALSKSNNHYQSLSKKKRNEEIQQKNNKWKIIKDQNNSFILDYTNNEVSKYLKSLQQNIKGEYGEIFLTNKYGALVATTAKLTTFAHGHKYWWQGAYNDGNGCIFLDDRGYDDSVGGYVLGVVVPIKKDNEIVGILKANLNILGSINTIIVNYQMKNHEKIKLIRSGGLIVFEEGLEPLSKRISSDLQEKLQTKSNESFVFEEKGSKFVVGFAEIKISTKMEGYNFGGSFESVDHKKGNSGESWLILDLNPFSNIIKHTTDIVSGLWFIGILLTVVFAITSFVIGKRTVKPLKELIIQTKRITKGNYDHGIITNRKDEIGELAISFNQMSNYLKKSREELEHLHLEMIRTSKMATVGRFSAGIAHEINNPLGAVLYYTRKIIADSEIKKQNRDNLDLILKGLIRIENIVRQILSYTGYRKTDLQPSNINHILKDAIVFIPHKKNNKMITLNLAPEETMPTVILNSSQIQQVFINIINNALDSIGPDGKLEIETFYKNEMIVIIFKDTGKGMDKEVLEKIFDPFFTTKDVGEGTGLGLFICYNILQLYNGTIDIRSNKGEGTEVTISLPAPNGNNE